MFSSSHCVNHLIFSCGGQGAVDSQAFLTFNTNTKVLETLTSCPNGHTRAPQGLLHTGGGTTQLFVITSGATTDIYTTSDYTSLYLPEFSGEDGGSLFPAPEALPHHITLLDTQGNTALQRKLEENFNSIERQLLALDPNADPDSFDPHR
jgi:hypothetical protein